MMRTIEQARVAMEENGLSVRLAADIVSKRYYPEIYAWLQFQTCCTLSSPLRRSGRGMIQGCGGA
jgi:hypothetical protein